MQQHENRDELTHDEARFVESVRAHYTPEPLEGARRGAFDARLRERLERPRWSGALLPAFAAASLGALALWLVPVAPATRVAPAAQGLPVAAVEAADANGSAWEQTLFYGDPTRDAVQDVSDELPPEFAAIDGIFFDGV